MKCIKPDGGRINDKFRYFESIIHFRMLYFYFLINLFAILRMTKLYEHIFPPTCLPIFAGNKTPPRLELKQSKPIIFQKRMYKRVLLYGSYLQYLLCQDRRYLIDVPGGKTYLLFILHFEETVFLFHTEEIIRWQEFPDFKACVCDGTFWPHRCVEFWYSCVEFL